MPLVVFRPPLEAMFMPVVMALPMVLQDTLSSARNWQMGQEQCCCPQLWHRCTIFLIAQSGPGMQGHSDFMHGLE